ncbi:hypothetical protein [Nereida sp. MMG025]|uniref:hypothetical protein n=1 Tax=Nereida sp. MMG025 TaxID=2909981 RepID=UPI001F3254C8|nr:hypothetical protein [Nereida sp. MMG025]MCF6445453.1 hypothetical protein [Nereida sp. MMG025]
MSLVLTPTVSLADAPIITNVELQRDNTVVAVTIQHPDTGWDHYADGFEVLTMDGTSLGVRTLFHPHVEEQPFTRSLTGVVIPEGHNQIQVRAKCSVDGWSETTTIVDLD